MSVSEGNDRSGGFFALRTPDGLYWTGRRWSRDPRKARRYDSGPDPYASAQRAASVLSKNVGKIEVAYSPRRARVGGD